MDVLLQLKKKIGKAMCALLFDVSNHSHKKYIAWKLARGYCLCYCKTFSLVPDSTECTKNYFTEECSILFVSPKVK